MSNIFLSELADLFGFSVGLNIWRMGIYSLEALGLYMRELGPEAGAKVLAGPVRYFGRGRDYNKFLYKIEDSLSSKVLKDKSFYWYHRWNFFECFSPDQIKNLIHQGIYDPLQLYDNKRNLDEQRVYMNKFGIKNGQMINEYLRLAATLLCQENRLEWSKVKLKNSMQENSMSSLVQIYIEDKTSAEKIYPDLAATPTYYHTPTLLTQQSIHMVRFKINFNPYTFVSGYYLYEMNCLSFSELISILIFYGKYLADPRMANVKYSFFVEYFVMPVLDSNPIESFY